jgi:hypothetical protein
LCHHYRCTKPQLPCFRVSASACCHTISSCTHTHTHTRCASRALLLYIQRTTELPDTIQAPSCCTCNCCGTSIQAATPAAARFQAREGWHTTPAPTHTPPEHTPANAESSPQSTHAEQKHCSPQVLRWCGYTSAAACLQSARQCGGCPCTWCAPAMLPIHSQHNKRIQKLPSNVNPVNGSQRAQYYSHRELCCS